MTPANELRIAIFPADGQRIDGKAPKKLATGSERKSTAQKQPILNILRNPLPNHPHPTVKRLSDKIKPPVISKKPQMIPQVMILELHLTNLSPHRITNRSLKAIWCIIKCCAQVKASTTLGRRDFDQRH